MLLIIQKNFQSCSLFYKYRRFKKKWPYSFDIFPIIRLKIMRSIKDGYIFFKHMTGMMKSKCDLSVYSRFLKREWYCICLSITLAIYVTFLAGEMVCLIHDFLI